MKIMTRQHLGISIVVSSISAVLAAIHLFVPNIKIDEIVLALFFVAIFPWLVPFLQSHMKRGRILGQEFEFFEQRMERQEERIERAESQVRDSQDKINTIVKYSLAANLFEHLSGLFHRRELTYHKNEGFDRQLRLLRDLGYLHHFRFDHLEDGENLVGKLELTPLGSLLVELREKD